MKITISFHWILHGLSLAILAPKLLPFVSQYLETSPATASRKDQKRPSSISSSPSSSSSSSSPSSSSSSPSSPSSSRPKRFSSSASCHGGDDIAQRRCRFRNLCYHIVDKSFLFSHDPENPAILKGVPEKRSEPALVELSSVENHNGFLFNYVDVRFTFFHSLRLHWIVTPALVAKRFNPYNIMHVFHDDLLPFYFTLKLHFGGGGGGGAASAAAAPNARLFLLDEWPNVTREVEDLYAALTPDETVLTIKWMEEFRRSDSIDAVCFSDALIGPEKDTTWYHYGFHAPQGPRRNPTLDADVHFKDFVSTYGDFFRRRADAFPSSPSTPPPPYILLLTRRQNRLILNEDSLVSHLASAFDSAVVVASHETHSYASIAVLTAGARVLVATHGSLLVFSLFAPKGAVVVEIFPYAVDPRHFTPYKTLAETKNVDLAYRSWRNLDEAKTVTHPSREPAAGGLLHLPLDERWRIEKSRNVEPALCCRDPEWLYRIYQDTVVDVEGVAERIRDGLEERGRILEDVRNRDEYPYALTPSEVRNVSCEFVPCPGGGEEAEPDYCAHLNFSPPMNWPHVLGLIGPRRSSTEKADGALFEVWFQPVDSDDPDAVLSFALSQSARYFSTADGVRADEDYYVWVRLIHRELALRGPFPIKPADCFSPL